MSNKGTFIIVAVAAALVVFVVVAVAPFITGSDDHYNLNNNGIKSSSVVIDDAVIVTEEIPDTVIEDDQQAIVEPEDVTVEAESETAPVSITEVVETETVPVVTEVTEVVETEVEQVSDGIETVVKEAEAEISEIADVATEAQVHIVTAQGLKYEPLVINIAVGDSVAWENMSSHDTQSMEGLIPVGAEAWHSAMGENFQHTFTVEGIYVYKCTPHFGAGMGGAIIVGNPTNLEDIKAQPVKGAAKRLVKKAVKAAEAM